MSTVTVSSVVKRDRQRTRPGAWLVAAPLVGIAIALFIVAMLIRYWLNGDNDLVMAMVIPFGIGAVISIAVAMLLYWLGLFYSPSLRFTFFYMSIIAATLTVVNGLVAANSMFVDRIIVIDTTILLLFATTVATAFNIGAFSRTTSGLKALADQSRQVAAGDYNVSVDVDGRDELAQLGAAFNEMAVELQEARAQREELDKLRRDLIAWVSHDLRTPLTSIRAMIEALNDGLITDEAETTRYYRSIRNDVIGLNRLIDDLFELAQLDAGGLKLNIEKASLGDLISDSLENFSVLAETRGVTLKGDISSNLDPVTMSSQKVERVLSNLISNALKYTPEGGTVLVNASRSQSAVTVSVCDSGKGFVSADLPFVFEKFYRGEGARSRLHGSSAGLGLAIARSIVEAHGGEIRAENAESGGAIVTFVLPQEV